MFWGLTIEPGKHYTQTVQESFHLSMVALDTRDVSTSEREHSKMSQLMIQHEKAEFLVCTLCYGTVFQQALDLNFTEGEEVTFFSEGRGSLHLTGYLVKDEPVSLDPDMVGLEELSSSDAAESDSGGWASGEESPGEGGIYRQSDYSARAYRKNTSTCVQNLTAKRKRCALSSEKFPRKHNRKRNYRERTSTDSVLWPGDHAGCGDEGRCLQTRQSSFGASSRLQEQHAILRTSNNVVATLILSDSAGVRKSATAISAGNRRRKTMVHHKIRKQKAARERVPRPVWHTTESRDPDVIMLSDSATSADDHGDLTSPQRIMSSVSRSFQAQIQPRLAAASRIESRMTGVPALPVDQTRTVIKQEPSSLPMATTEGRLKPADLHTGESSCQTKSAVPPKVRSKKPTQKSKIPRQRLGKRISLQARKKTQQKKIAPGSGKRGRPKKVTIAQEAGMQSHQPFISSVVGGQEAVQICGLDAAFSSRMPENGNHIPSHSETLHHAEYQSGSTEPVISTSHMDTLCPVGEQSSMSACTSNDPAWLPQGMGTVTWSCESETDQAKDQTLAMPADGIPVASDTGFLTQPELFRNDENIGKELLRLAHGFDVFIGRWDFFEVGMVSPKGWKIVIRRLLDVFFDRATLAASSPSLQENGAFGYKALDQNIVAAILAFIGARYQIPKNRITQAICSYCSDCRKNPFARARGNKKRLSFRPVQQS